MALCWYGRMARGWRSCWYGRTWREEKDYCCIIAYRHRQACCICWLERGLRLSARFDEMVGGRKNKNNNPQNGINSSTTSRIHMSIERKCWTKTDLFVYFSFHFPFYYYFYEFKFHNKCRVRFGSVQFRRHEQWLARFLRKFEIVSLEMWCNW